MSSWSNFLISLLQPWQTLTKNTHACLSFRTVQKEAYANLKIRILVRIRIDILRIIFAFLGT